eukprot:jgi/Galph1/1072/GphlegSOOS_G5847.1
MTKNHSNYHRFHNKRLFWERERKSFCNKPFHCRWHSYTIRILCFFALLVISLWLGNRLLREKSRSSFLFIAIISRPGEYNTRKAIRNTWLRKVNNDVTYKFFIGRNSQSLSESKQIEAEKVTYQDLIILPVHDTYENLTLKSVLAFDWISKNSKSPFILKSDTDVYVRVDDLVSRLRSENATEFYMGTLVPFGSSKPLNFGGWKTHRWYMSPEEYPFRFWPPYVFGFAYVISLDLAHAIAKCLPDDPSCSINGHYNTCQSSKCPFFLVKFEDVTIGGIIFFATNKDVPLSILDCSENICLLAGRKLSIAIDEERFINEPYYYGKRKCNETFLAIHRVKPEKMIKYAENLSSGRHAMMCDDDFIRYF